MSDYEILWNFISVSGWNPQESKGGPNSFSVFAKKMFEFLRSDKAVINFRNTYGRELAFCYPEGDWLDSAEGHIAIDGGEQFKVCLEFDWIDNGVGRA